VSFLIFVLSDRSLCDELIIIAEESYFLLFILHILYKNTLYDTLETVLRKIESIIHGADCLYFVYKLAAEHRCTLHFRTVSHRLFFGHDIIVLQLSATECHLE